MMSSGKGNQVETAETKKSKRKLPSATAIILAALIIVIIVANAVVWKNRLPRSAEIASLTTEISQVSQEIRKTPAPPSNLQARLTEATANLTAAQTVLPPEFNRNNIIDYIINLSRACQVEVLPIASQGWTEEKGGQFYQVLKLTATLTGSFTQANDFIYRLQHGEYKTLVVPELSFTRRSSPDSAAIFSGDNTMVAVKLSIAIYARPAASGTGTK